MSLFQRDRYPIAEINSLMSHIEASRAAFREYQNMYRTSQVKQPDGSIRRDEAIRELAEQERKNLMIANRVVEKILSSVAGKDVTRIK